MSQYDSIVIGSGISGLTAACLLAKVKGEKVLLLEQHNIIGGFTHTFRRGKFEWDTGLHYVGNMGKSDFPRKVMDFITDGQVEWLKMPEPFEFFHFPNFKFAQRSGEGQLTEDMIALFPGERAAIEKYFRDLGRVQTWGTLHFAAQILPWFLAWIPRLAALPRRQMGRTKLKEYLDLNIKNSELAALLAGPCGDYGLAPSEASLFIHALIVRHYINGGYYPQGGSQKLPETLRVHLQKLGVEILTRHEAKQIVVEKNRVTGVLAASRGQEKLFHARKVISTVGAKATYLRLLSGGRSLSFEKEIQNFPAGMTMATLYLGLKSTPEVLGFKGENHWLFASSDFEGMHARQNLPGGEVQGCYISFPSLKNRIADPHTVEILVPASFETFAAVSEGGWKKRGQKYENYKTELAGKVLDFVEKKFPGFGALVDYIEVSTPLSIKHFTHHAQGEAYGLPAIPSRYKMKWLGPKTHIKGLYLAGADVLAHGIVGAMMSGLCAYTASGSLKDVIRLFKSLGKNPV